jgi:hypothetical protein
MATMRVFRQDDFTGGLNLRADQFQLAPNESPRMLNVEIDPRGGVFSRGAMRAINTVPVSADWSPKILKQFSGATSNYIMLGTGSVDLGLGGVYYSQGSNFENLEIFVSSKNGPSFAAWGSDLYISTGGTYPSYVWNGSTKTALTASGPTWQNTYTSPDIVNKHMPSAEHSVTHAGKLFVANTRENGVNHPNRIRWSHPNNPTNWANLDYIDINDGGAEIRALTVFAGHLVVFKPNGVYAIFGYDSDSFQVVEVSRSVGCPTPQAVATTERGVYFFSYPDGLMLYNGERIVDLFEPIRPALDAGDINPLAVNEIHVNYINRRVWVSVPYSSADTVISTINYPTSSFVYDPTVSQRGAWLLFASADGRGAAGGCTFVETNGSTRHLVIHPTQPFVLQVDLYNVPFDNIDGTDLQFSSRYRTRWMDAGSYSQKKMFRRPDVVAKQNAVESVIGIRAFGDYEEADTGGIKTYTVSIPASGSGMIWGLSNWGANWGPPNRGSQIITGRSIGLARSIQLEFTGPTGQPWGINSYTLKYNPRRVKQ